MILSKAITRQAYIRPPQTGLYDNNAEFSSAVTLFGKPSMEIAANNDTNILRFRRSQPNLFDGQGTIEFWYYRTANPVGIRPVFQMFNAISNNIRILTRADGGIQASARFGGTTFSTDFYSTNINEWNHIAVTLENNQSLTFWINGERKQTLGDIGEDLVTVGGDTYALHGGEINGLSYRREFRVSRIARYNNANATYDVPTGPFISDPDTYMLFHMDGDDENTEGILQLIDDVTQPFAPFIIEVDTAITGTGTATTTSQFRLPTTGSGYNFTVNWGDGVTETYTGSPGNITHTYPTPGIYDIKISGAFPRIAYNGVGDRNKLLKIKQWGAIAWEGFAGAFSGCNNLQITAADTPNLSLALSLSGMFNNCTNPNFSTSHNFNAWNTSNVTSMATMFQNASSFNQYIGDWNVSNVTTMNSMFNGATVFNQNLSGWCVQQIPTEPSGFKTGSALTVPNTPVWGAPC
jgi:hypothetical protein